MYLFTSSSLSRGYALRIPLFPVRRFHGPDRSAHQLLTVVESNFLTIDGDTHGYQFVYQRIAHPTHAKCIDKDNDDGQQMVEENHESVPRACSQSLLV